MAAAGLATSWYSWALSSPANPLSIVANAYVKNGATTTEGKYENATDFLATTWASSSPINVTAIPVVVALGTDSVQNEADATQWTFSHLTGNLNSSTAIPIRKVFFPRGGTQWETQFTFSSGVTNIVDMLLTFRDNAGTQGNVQGEVPCIGFRGYNNTGTFTLGITFKDGVFGRFIFGLWAKDNGGNISMLELELVVVGPNSVQGLALNNLKVQSLMMGNVAGGNGGATLATACGNTCGNTCACQPMTLGTACQVA